MKTKMHGLVKKRSAPGLELQELSIPVPGPNDILIKVTKTAICGTDLHIYNWNEWAQNSIKVPLLVGHEFVGNIVAMGKNVHDFKEGDVVSGEGHIVCGHCRNCLAGRKHLCRNTRGVGVSRPGAFAHYICLPQSNVWYCDHTIPEDILATFDPLGNATHTALTYDLLGEDVLITGAGPIGIMAAAIAKHAGARFIVVTDINPYRLELAKKMGVTRTVNVKEEKIEDVMKKLGMKEGFDVGLEMSGNSQAFESMLENMFHGGKIALLGILPPNTEVNWDLIVFNGLTIKGIFGRKMFETWYKMTSMIQSGLDISQVITHHFDYRDFEKGFEVMNSGKSGKVILEWN